MKSLFAAIGASAMAFGALPAAAQSISNPKGVVSDFNVQQVGQVLDDIGAIWQAVELDNGNPIILANYKGVLNFRLIPVACRAAGFSNCIGLSMSAVFEGQANPQTVTAFNYRYDFASIGLTPDGEAFVNRYDIADFGIPRGNLASSLLNFVALSDRFRNELATASRTVSLQGYADDLSASYLNRVELNKAGGEGHIAAESFGHQNVDFEAAAETVRQSIADKKLPRNKILNQPSGQ